MSKIVGFKTVNKDMGSWYDPAFKYEVGKTYSVDNPDRSGASCGRGLHFSPTAKDAIDHAYSHDKYRLFVVEADEKDLLGKDSDKFRVSKLKIVREVNISTERAQKKLALKKLTNRCKAIPKSYLNVANAKYVTTQKIHGVLKAWAKREQVKNLKVYITDNMFEASVMGADDTWSWNDSEVEAKDYVKVSVKSIPNLYLEDYPFNYAVEHILNGTFGYTESGNPFNGLLELLELGLLPMRIDRSLVVVLRPTKSTWKKFSF